MQSPDALDRRAFQGLVAGSTCDLIHQPQHEIAEFAAGSMTGITATTAGRVPALTEELDRYPDDRVEIADELPQAGDDEAALGWLRTLPAAGGFDGSMARVQLAEIHFDSGRADPAVAELDAIKDSRVRDPHAYAKAAELLEERGDEQGALLMSRRRTGEPSGSSADRAPNPPAAQRPGAGSLLPHQGGQKFDHRLDRTSLTCVAEVDAVVVQTLIEPR